MDDIRNLIIDLVIILILVAGISQFRGPARARWGNMAEALAMFLAIGTVLLRHRITDPMIVVPVALAGAAAGWLIAARVSMVQIPAMVAFQHGAGGVAALLVAYVELTRTTHTQASTAGIVAGLMGLILGSATFSGSMIASGKLSNRLKQTPTVLSHHGLILLNLVVAAAFLATLAGIQYSHTQIHGFLIALIAMSIILGVVFSMRIGGADMPVLISFLNATAGLAAAFCGLTIQNRLLIACGATVAASGSILTHIMCVSMNRSLLSVCLGLQQEIRKSGQASDPEVASDEPPPIQAAPPAEVIQASDNNGLDPLTNAVLAAQQAQTIVIIPGYGMALAEAQFEVVQLAEILEAAGKEVRFAVHPVAGRMPGHMHVLLAEAEVNYQKLWEMDRINSEFSKTDLAIIVGACDVVNPAAIQAENTPISGMPILLAHEAKRIIVCNLNEKPGYSGVANPLYQNPKTILLFGDAKDNVQSMLDRLN